MALDDYGPAVLVSMWAMFLLTSGCTSCAVVVVGLRVYARVKFEKFGYDDWIIVVCWLVFLVTAVIVTSVVSWGFGKHIYDIPPADRPRAREGQVIGTCAIIMSFAAPKFGIMATVQRATNPPTTFWMRMFYVNWVLCTASFVFLLSVSVFQFEQCKPVSYQWELVPGTGSCIDSQVNIRLAYTSSAFSTVLDFYFSLLPAAIIWKLQMSSKSRVMMIMILGGASSATIASAVKMWKLGDAIAQIADDPTCNFPDAMSEIYILVYAETTLLIVGSSIAAVFPLFYAGLPGTSGNRVTGSNNGTPLRTFGQGTYKRRKGFFEDDETTLTRGDATGDASETPVEGIVKTTDVEQTWASADAEFHSTCRSRQLGLTPGTI